MTLILLFDPLLRNLNSSSVIDTRLQWRDQSAEQYVNPFAGTDTGVQLKPWVGVWVKVNQACTLVYYPSKRIPQSSSVKRQAAVYPAEADRTNWRLQIMAYSGKSEIRDEYTFIGVAPKAEDGEDINDIWKAPGLPGDLQILVGDASREYRPMASHGLLEAINYYSVSLASPVKTATLWPILIRGPRGPVTLKWDASAIPPEYGAFVVGSPAGAVDMQKASSLGVAISDERSFLQLLLVVGHPEYLSAFLAPDLSKEHTFAFPNPGPDGLGYMTFKYNLQSAGEVSLKIYDVSGRLVNVLKESGLPGVNAGLKWDTTNKNGQKVGSGIYIFILETGGRKIVDKIGIVR